ncbi:MAG: S9 family peptidase [Gammaproteobacteria bacterium]|nr:S9 family peptidase [Gammaproteobacteria bacterium]TVQ44427.1 MAG: S9 family peptidase [Gammaproteobacteria bacterium]
MSSPSLSFLSRFACTRDRVRVGGAVAAVLALALLLAGCAPGEPPAPRSDAAGEAARAYAAAAAGLPVAPVRNVPETFFGTTVDDPYRWLEDTTEPEAAAWMRAHSDHAHAVLGAIEGRDRIRARLEELDAAVPARVGSVVRRPGELYFYQRRGAGEEQFKLYVQTGLEGEPRRLFDPEPLAEAAGVPHAINYFSASPDGSLVAVGVSAAGSEEAAMRILDTATGEQLGPEIDRALFGAISWSPDSDEIFFHRVQALAPDQPAIDKYRHSEAVAMRPGDDEDGIRTLIRAGHDLGIPETEFAYVSIQPDGLALLYVIDGVSPDFAVWVTTLDALRSDDASWRPLVSRDDRVVDLAVREGQVIVRSFRDAPRFRLLSGPLEDFSLANAEVLVPETDQVLTGMALPADALYFSRRDGNVQRLYRMPPGGGEITEVELPVLGAFSLTATSELPGLLMSLQSWTRARQIYAVSPEGSVVNTGLQPAGPFDAPDDLVATEVMVPSHDGVEVPMSILHRRGVAQDGSHPTLLYAYASYGFTEEPFFSLNTLAWLEAGGVFAVANPRGSGVFGRDWHEAGKQTTKPNSWKDLNAAAEYLVEQGWTTPSRLAAWGGSAGGLLVGRALTDRPELYAAVVPMVGALDMVRMETTPNGVPNIPEFGTRVHEEGFRALLAMSTYHQVRDGVAYPAVLLTHGVNDPRVEVWHTTKTAARLMAASASDRPVLMRLDYASGHGVGDTRSQVFDERADVYAFLFWQMGMPGWSPRL